MSYQLQLIPENIFFSSKIEENFELLFAAYAERIAELKEVSISKINLNEENCWYFEAVTPEGVKCSCHGDTLYNTFCYGVLMTMIVDWDDKVYEFEGKQYRLNKKNISALQSIYIHNTLFPDIDRMLLSYSEENYSDYTALSSYGFVSVKLTSEDKIISEAQNAEQAEQTKNLIKLLKKNPDPVNKGYIISYRLKPLGFAFAEQIFGKKD